VQDLVRRGLATALASDKEGNATTVRISSKGHDAMVAPQMENGRRLRAWRESQKVSRETLAPPAPQVLPPDDPWFDIGSHAK
jgi:hypothetical protein